MSSDEHYSYLSKKCKMTTGLLKGLVGNGQPLVFEGILSITPGAAKMLTRHNSNLGFVNVAELSPEIAKVLFKHEWGLCIEMPRDKSGATSLTPSMAALASKHRAGLGLSNVPGLCSEVAKNLAKHRGGDLKLPDLQAISDEVAAEISKYRGHLAMGLPTLSPSVAEILGKALETRHEESWGKFRQSKEIGGTLLSLHLPRLTEISPEAARNLCRSSRGELNLGVTSLTPEAARGLANHEGALLLPSLRELDKETASELARGRCSLFLGGDGELTLTPETAAALSESEGVLGLPNLPALTPETAKSLASGKCWDLTIGVPKLTEPVAAEIALFKGVVLTLRSRTKLLPSVAKILQSVPCEQLCLETGLKLSVESARELARFKGILNLLNVTELPFPVASALVDRVGDLWLVNLRHASDAVLRKLAKHEGDLWLHNLEYISPGAAKAMTDHRGTVVLTGLVDPSREVLEILAANGNVILPGMNDEDYWI
jgi:hypothetical protein